MLPLSNLENSSIGKGMNLSRLFSDISGKMEFNEGVSRVNQSLNIILQTVNGEVVMFPIVGSGIMQLLFEPADDILIDKMELYVRDAIEKLEPRIGLQDVVVSTNENFVFVTVTYILSGTNMEGKFEYEFTRQSKGDVY